MLYIQSNFFFVSLLQLKIVDCFNKQDLVYLKISKYVHTIYMACETRVCFHGELGSRFQTLHSW